MTGQGKTPAASARRRTTDSPLEAPNGRRALSTLRRLLRLRCPHCGRGPVLLRWFSLHDRCSACAFRYERSDENYFQGAMFVNFMLGGATFAVGLLAIILLSWPDIPWNALTFGIPVFMIGFMIFLYPISKVVWLSVDVMLRPVTPDELE